MNDWRDLRRRLRVWMGVALTVVALASTRTARADDDACIAASESEIPLRKAGKLSEALAQLALCAAPGCPGQISAECGRRIREINVILPTVVLGAVDGASNDLAAVTVTVDGAPFVTTLDGHAVPMNPGAHQLRFQAAGMAPVEKTVVVREGEKDRRVNVVLQPAGAPTAKAALENNARAQAHQTYAEVAWGAGVIGLIVGGIAGIDALEEGAIQSTCGVTVNCGNNTTATDVAIGGLSVAVVGGITGTIFWFTAPEKVRVVTASAPTMTIAPLLARGERGLALVGSF